jgi:hypothetical protein
MPPLDLSGPRAVIEELILSASTLRAYRDNGVGDDVLDEGTGELVAPAVSELYDGPGAIQPIATGGMRGVPDLDVAVTPLEKDTTHRALFPVSMSADLYLGDVVTATEVNPLTGNPELEGELFEVSELPNFGTVSAVKIVFLRPKRKALVPQVEDEGP